MTVVGTRPEIIRLSAVINRLESSEAIDHVLVHTGQNYDYELNEVFFEDFKLKKPDYFLNAATGTAIETVGNILIKIDPILEEVKPDAFLVLGDTNSCLCAIAAKRRHIPIFHMEAGNRCFDFNVPEEINRRVVDHLSDINLAYTENARRYLISEGKRTDDVYVTGSPMTEIIQKNMDRINQSDILEKLGLEKNNYFVVSVHREENLDIGNNFEILCRSLNEIAEYYQKSIIFSTHPRTKKRIEQEKITFNSLIRNLEPLGFIDYNALQKNSFCVLSDSGTVSEEASIIHFPGVSLRTSTERPEGLEAGTFILGGIDKDSMINAIEIATKTAIDKDNIMVNDYQDTNVSDKVVKIINSYIGIINTRTWKKH